MRKRLVHYRNIIGFMIRPCAPGAGHRRAKSSREGGNFDLLKVVLAGVPLPIDLHLEVEVLVYAPRVVTPPLPRRRFEAHAVVTVLLAVYDVDGIAVVLDATVQGLRLQPRVY